MSGILRLENLNKGTTLKQGDKTVLSYRLSDADGDNLNIAGNTAVARLMHPDFTRIGYESEALTVSEDNIVQFSIDSIIPSRLYYLEITVDGQYIFPSRSDEGKLSIDRSSMGAEITIIENAGIDAVVRKAVDLINEDPSLIIDEDKLISEIIANTAVGSIEEYYQEYRDAIKEYADLKPKALNAVSQSAEAITKSQNALNVANGIDAKATNALDLSKSADTLSKSVQDQFNQVVIDGDSSVEAAQARVTAGGVTKATLKERLDDEHTEVAAQLAQNEKFYTNQIDFVKLLQETNEVAEKLYVKIKSDRTFDVMIPFKGDRVAHFELKKDNNDDFIKIGDIKVSNLTITETSFMQNYDILDGSFNMNGAPNYYANPHGVGSTFTFEFEGTGFDFQHRADASGGVWEFVVDGDEENAVQVSTHINASPASFSTKPVFRDLENKEHQVVATFIGDDPENSPSGGEGTSRGWLSVNTGSDPGRETFVIYGYSKDAVPEFTVNTGSNKEFAFSHGISLDGETWESTYWIPEHNGIGTAFLGEQRIYLDNELINNWTPDGRIIEVKSVRIIQKLYGKHPSDPSSNSAEVNSITTVSAKGVSVQAKIKALRPMTIEGGHVLMLVADNTFANELITSYGTRYDATISDESREDLVEDDKAMSYAFINNTGTQAQKDTVIAVTINNIANTFRWGQPNRKPDGMVWLNHRASLQKLYPHVMRGHTMDTGDEYEISGIYFLGELPMAGDILPNK